MEKRNEILLAAVNSFLRKGEMDKVISVLDKIHPADAAEIVEELNDDERKKVFQTWGPDHSADALLEMDEKEQVDVAESLSISLISDILDEMPSDDAADLLGDLSPETTKKILETMEPEEAEEVRKLLKYPEQTAGGLMTPEFVALDKNMTAQQAIEQLREMSPDVENAYYVFVTNKENQLSGVISLRDLVIAKPGESIKNIMNPDVIYTETTTDQEEVAKIMAKYDLLALPVIDKGHHLLGTVTIDDVVDVIEEEATEDMYRLSGTGGIGESDVMENPIPTVVKARMPWLLVALIGEVLVVGFVASRFTYLLAAVPALAIYWACMTSVGGNTSFQASTIAVRGLATGEIDTKSMFLRVLYEVRLGLILGIIMAIILFIIALFWQKMFPLAVTVAVANIAIVISGALTGAVAPIIFDRLGIDPAVSSNPFLALLMDALSLLIYFIIATVILRIYHVI